MYAMQNALTCRNLEINVLIPYKRNDDDSFTTLYKCIQGRKASKYNLHGKIENRNRYRFEGQSERYLDEDYNNNL